MVNFTSNTSQMNREILTFTNKISKHLSKPDKKFSADMTYGILASESCLLTDIVDHLHENTKKVNSVERLTRHLNNGTSSTALKSYLTTIRKWARRNLLYTLMTETLQSLMVTNLRLSDLLSETALKVLLPKQFM
ncbi:MAG: hypothetical protein ACLUAR_04625 [Pilosibacter sp.]